MALPRVVRSAMSRIATGEGAPADSTDELLRILGGTVHRARAGARLRIDRRLRSPLGRRLLGRLRAAVIEVAAESGDEPADAIAILAAIEHVAKAIGSGPTGHEPRSLDPAALDLLAAVADSARSPLSSILFLAGTLQREQSGSLNAVQRRQLGVIYGAALALSSVANDVIELERDEDGLSESEPRPFSLVTILESVRDVVRPIADEKQVAVRLVSPSANSRSGHPMVLSRVLLTLVANALRSTREGYVALEVREVGPARLQFNVRDSSLGIASGDVLRSLYRPLRRSADRKLVFSESALGLAMCRKLVRALGSELEVESWRGWGTRFYFELILPESPDPRAQIGSAAPFSAHHGD
jgi:signal transduction histidine kinase